MSAFNELPGYTDGAEVIRVESRETQIDAISHVIYSQVKSVAEIRQLRMSLLIPRSEQKKPAILYFPGGGFMSAHHEKYIGMRYALAKAGFVVAAVEYRVIPNPYPSLIEDGKAAVRFLREHAEEYGIDSARIGVVGDSAGGYMAQMMAMTNGQRTFDKGRYLQHASDVQAAATLYGISNLLNITEGFSPEAQAIQRSPAITQALLINGVAFKEHGGAPITADPARALAASPMGHLEGPKPPFLIMHGSADTLVSPVQSQQLYEALKARGNQAEYVIIDGAEHADLHWFQPAVIDRVVSWFCQALDHPAP
ncbi:alpha/beta hydrolase [Nissabacter archeti]|uniref:Alpha/beta hydrolase n=1 Tax=Nissabacter archeti TaxID=1917880 RepID=A0ABS5JI08_9GAMM|nr:alpha/beta hydrolase [Nissabacter archeti]MBS0969522.1 alpha/beta hydrolase [Nissabacter archeti]